uniref:Gag-pol polyprotein n=1 Tax=Solanum tuberosum TaxID=4113 RepID=M1DAA3_SOLTU
MGVSDLVEEECHMAMLPDDMNICRLMMYAQSIEKSKLKRKNREMKRVRSDEQGQSRFKKIAPKQDSSRTPKVNQERGNGPQFSKPTCTTYGKRHYGNCLAGTIGCYDCGKNDHQVDDCLDPNAPKKNHFYVLQAKKEKGALPDEGTGILIVP